MSNLLPSNNGTSSSSSVDNEPVIVVPQACGAARARLIENAKLEAERTAQREKLASAAEQAKNVPTGPNPASDLLVTEKFITLMDCLRVNDRSVDSVYPYLQELLAVIPRVHPQFDQDR